ncbi:MAG: hypothetical protein AUH85_03405 [Chloroflexi bacterium 13_1_40CM_4_68_4]|nr:MAG: hypothetical protein AUH85_03405 [Chloroflexi bacterium 13_1_40CM_4_68_4]
MATAIAPERKTETSALADERPFTRGSVWMVEFIRVKPGRDLEYWKVLAQTWKKILDEEKKEGSVLSYKILSGYPTSRDDFTAILMVESPNFAAFDQSDKMDAIVKKVHGSLGAAQESFRMREDIRENLGGRLMREIHLK